MGLVRTLFSVQLASILCAVAVAATNVTDFMVAWSLDGSIIFTDGHNHADQWNQTRKDAPAARNATTGEKVWQGPTVPDDISDVDTGPISYSAGRLISTCWSKGSAPPEPPKSYTGAVSFCFFSAENGNLLKVVNTSKSHTSPYINFASADGKYLADIDCDNQGEYYCINGGPDVRIWNADDGDFVMNLKHSNGFFQEPDQVQTMAFSPDGKHVVTAGGDGQNEDNMGMVSLWNLGTRKRIKLKDHTAPPTTWGGPMYPQLGVAFSPDSKYFATVGGACPRGPCVVNDNCTIRVWDVAAGTLRRIDTGFKKFCGDKVLWSPDGAKIATLSLYYGHWHIWDAVTGECYMDIAIPQDPFHDYVNRGLWSPDGSHFAWQQYRGWPLQGLGNGPIHIVPFKRAGCGLADLVV